MSKYDIIIVKKFIIIMEKESKFIRYREFSRMGGKVKTIMQEKKLEIMLLQKEEERRKKIKEKIQRNFDFAIPTYVLEDIIDEEDFMHICSIINLAIINGGICEKNAEILKKYIIDKCEIKNIHVHISLNKIYK